MTNNPQQDSQTITIHLNYLLAYMAIGWGTMVYHLIVYSAERDKVVQSLGSAFFWPFYWFVESARILIGLTLNL